MVTATTNVQSTLYKDNSVPQERGFWRFYGTCILIYSLIFNFWQTQPVPLNVHLVAIGLTATCLYPLARWYKKGLNEVPIFELICLSYALQFSMPVYIQPNGIIIFSRFIPFDWNVTLRALLLVELGMIGLIVGYTITKRNVFFKFLPTIDLPIDERKRNSYLFFSLVVGGGFMLLNTIGFSILRSPSFSAISLLLSRQFLVAVVILGFSLYEHQIKQFNSWIRLYIAVGFAILVGLATGFLETTLIPLVLLLVVRWQYTRIIPWRILIIGLFAILVLQPIKGEFRQQSWYGGVSSYSQRIALWAELGADSATQLLSADSLVTNERALTETLSRFDLLHRFIHVVSLTPDTVPYYQGQTYSYFFVAWIPRIVWPGKPIATYWSSQLDYDYRLKNIGSHTSVGIGQLAEAYANFGAIGVFFVMAALGSILAIFSRMFNGPQSEGGRAIYLVLMIYFLNGIGAATATQFGALLQNTVANVALIRPFAKQLSVDDD